MTQPAPLTLLTEPLPSLRGLVPLHTARGARFPAEDLERWLLINRVLFKAQRGDLLVRVADVRPGDALFDFAAEQELALSLRAGGACVPLGWAEWLPRFHDICLELGPEVEESYALEWREAAGAAGLAIRVYCPGPWTAPQTLALRRLCAAPTPVRQVVAALDPMGAPPHRVRGHDAAHASLHELAKLGETALDAGIDFSVYGVSPDYLPADLAPHALGWAEAINDSAHYIPESAELALRLYHSGRARAATALYALLAQSTQRLSQLDNLVLRILLHRLTPVQNALGGLHRLTRLSGWLRSVARPRRWPEPVSEPRRKQLEDYERALWSHAYPALAWRPVPRPTAPRARWVDALAAEQLVPRYAPPLVLEAQRRLREEPPTREISADEYGAANAHTIALPGAHRWFSLANVEKVSPPLGTFDAPYTLSFTLGGGTAEYAGFAFGRHARLLAPAVRLDHHFALHVAADGRYVFLRDGQPIAPTEFVGPYFVPRRIPQRGRPLIALWNIDVEVVTQRVLLWQEAPEAAPAVPVTPPLFSFIIVCSRYARRLQAALRALLHAEGITPAQIEVLVAYVPGIDPTDDVLDSFALAYPELRIVRLPFSPREAKSKGLLINEAAQLARGAWFVIMDADVIVPPPLLARICDVGEGVAMVAPDGRKMLDRETTARVLLGEADPVRDWQALLAGPGEWRQREAQGMPIGFFQCVRPYCFSKVRYVEQGDFEGADWHFALEVQNHYGPAKWIDGLPVLHLDHGGSQWFGTQKQY